MTLSHGGHYFAGAWAVVLLRDYVDGSDFADASPDVHFDMSAVDESNVDEFLSKLGGDGWGSIDFSGFSKSRGGVAKYDFSARAILNAVK
ncbi:MAG: hypothetical protein JJ979_13765 [Roseibium sp.]|nr:hypothetical protein [Roseibium sp.]